MLPTACIRGLHGRSESHEPTTFKLPPGNNADNFRAGGTVRGGGVGRTDTATNDDRHPTGTQRRTRAVSVRDAAPSARRNNRSRVGVCARHARAHTGDVTRQAPVEMCMLRGPDKPARNETTHPIRARTQSRRIPGVRPRRTRGRRVPCRITAIGGIAELLRRRCRVDPQLAKFIYFQRSP